MKLYNDAAADQFNNEVLEKCHGCGRTFNPESLAKHQKLCLKDKPVNQENITSPTENGGLNWKAAPDALRPKALFCYICGREFGTASLEIHIKSCKKKWEAQEAWKPKNERKPLPMPP